MFYKIIKIQFYCVNFLLKLFLLFFIVNIFLEKNIFGEICGCFCVLIHFSLIDLHCLRIKYISKQNIEKEFILFDLKKTFLNIFQNQSEIWRVFTRLKHENDLSYLHISDKNKENFTYNWKLTKILKFKGTFLSNPIGVTTFVLRSTLSYW